MAKARTQFICQNCNASYPKWTGKCDNCGEWNTLVEQLPVASGNSAVARGASSGRVLVPQTMQAIGAEKSIHRLGTGIADLDIVLGGGILPGGVVLLAGQPGIGKSTLLLQITAHIAQTQPVLYASGEESAGQVKLRAERLGAHTSEQLSFVASTSADDIAATIRSGAYKLVIIDSIQTLSLDEITSAPGSVSQITNSSNVIIRAAKEAGAAVVLVGHVTKEGSIAGPKVLEHLVDVVLQFEGDRYGGFKVVRAIKNRYGSTAEAAIFEMAEEGLRVVENPSAALLAERQNADGSVVMATLEGTRPLLVEIQALVNPTSFGYPKRTASGFDLNRLNVLIAVLERRTKLNLSDKDIYINVVGGLRLADPAADLAVCMAIASASAGRRLDENVVVFGEVGLGGEVRSVLSSDRRVAEAKKLGFTQAIAPKYGNKNTFIKGVGDLRQALIDYLQK
ncbi:DNA repair protein RadA [Candidatus Saccharibacteria bacterium RIFCSPHIGHO2_01_FULL_45_15]|nr:MAG: DNA repair protein RadA [Candidatus Saccharibacteria bacterium RIFCSPHIGHO2_01_FULL_45_15]OGL27988.1 MAG: DNA repair protein RadA [Candidatus Saccharibacteria bacterium RIFCSPHIGHO2_02_FULL_46_12]OGL31705.1 MAG: DNA repair protein RadA [Candidatus Saccharibacteria bacterium RIFCSPHIGHO2_12_FULL_44_22]